jgi:lambda repressor-like predicted transcriptional regulator
VKEGKPSAADVNAASQALDANRRAVRAGDKIAVNSLSAAADAAAVLAGANNANAKALAAFHKGTKAELQHALNEAEKRTQQLRKMSGQKNSVASVSEKRNAQAEEAAEKAAAAALLGGNSNAAINPDVVLAAVRRSGVPVDAANIIAALKKAGVALTPASIAAALKNAGLSAEHIARILKAMGIPAQDIAKSLSSAGVASDPASIARAMAAAGLSPQEIASALSNSVWPRTFNLSSRPSRMLASSSALPTFARRSPATSLPTLARSRSLMRSFVTRTLESRARRLISLRPFARPELPSHRRTLPLHCARLVYLLPTSRRPSRP